MTSTASTASTPQPVVGFPDLDADDLMTLSEVAAILRVPVNTLRWWRQQGTGPVFFKMGRHLVTTAGDVRRFIEEQRRGAAGARRLDGVPAVRPGRPTA